jgi:hypothetical protein
MLTTPNADLALNGAKIYICITIFAYLLTIDLLLTRVFKLYSISNNSFMLVGILFSIVIFYFNYSYFKKDDLYIKIEERFSKENERQKLLGNIFVFVLFIGSIISFMLTGYLINKYLSIN